MREPPYRWPKVTLRRWMHSTIIILFTCIIGFVLAHLSKTARNDIVYSLSLIIPLSIVFLSCFATVAILLIGPIVKTLRQRKEAQKENEQATKQLITKT